MNTKLLTELLEQFNVESDRWFKVNNSIEQKYKFFEAFFSKIRHNKFSTETQFFGEFEEMCDNLLSLTTNKIALARAKGKSIKPYGYKEYVKRLLHLIDEKLPLEERIEDALEAKSEYNLKYFGQSSVSELVAYSKPHEYTMFTQRERQVVNYLGIKITSKKFGEYYSEFNQFIKDNILREYATSVYSEALKYDSKLKNIGFVFGNQPIVPSERLKSRTTLMLEIDQFFSWIFETKPVREINNCFIDNIVVKNFYTIKDEIELSELKTKKFIFLLGENGCGKSILLKAILITLKKSFIETQASKEITGIIDDILNYNKEFFLSATGYGDSDTENCDEFHTKGTVFLKNLYAYGTNRHKISQTARGEQYGFLTLFKNDEYLINSEEWLKKIRFSELENRNNRKSKYLKINDIEKILCDLLDLPGLKLDVNSDKVTFLVDTVEYSLLQLSEGFISVITFIIDLIARLHENNPTILDIKQIKAVVLIDELDMFLHPNWEKNICNKLVNWFPQIQFFITTHSPILIQGAPKDKSIIYRLKKENNKTQIAYKYNGTDIEEWLPNILISSPLFSPDFLDTIPKDIILKMRTDKDFNKLMEANANIEQLRLKETELLKKYSEILDKTYK